MRNLTGIVYSLAAPAEISRLAAAAGGYHALLGAEADLAGSYRNDEAAAAFLASRALLRMLAAHLLEVPAGRAAGLRLSRRCRTCGGTGHGKPHVAGLEVSLSRTRTLVLAAAGPAGTRLGADVEGVPGSVFEGFDETVLSPAERSRAGTGRAGTLQRMQLWSAKEAALKATGHGLAVEPVLLSVDCASVPADGSTGLFSARVRCARQPELDGLHLAWVPAGDHHVAALACSTALPAAALPASRLFAG